MKRVALTAGFLAVVLLGPTGCRFDEAPLEPPSMSYSDSSIVVRPDDCEGLLDECGGVDVRFPVLIGGAEGAADKINRHITAFFVDQLGAGDSESTAMPDIRAAAQLVLADYTDFKQDFPLSEQVWFVQGIGQITTIDTVVSIRVETYSYLGGAHSNTQVAFIMADTRTGEKVGLAELAADPEAFHAAAEKEFRRSAGMADTDNDYATKGYWFNDNQFVLPENIGLTPDSVVLYYNAYEIAPYSMGPTTIKLPRTVLSN